MSVALLFCLLVDVGVHSILARVLFAFRSLDGLAFQRQKNVT